MRSRAAIEALGYTVGVSQYDTAVEEAALADARAKARPEVVEEDAAEVTRQVVEQLRLRGVKNEVLVARAAVVAAKVLEETQNARNSRVAFHERAHEIAAAAPTVYSISGYGLTALHVSIDDATGEPADSTDAELLAAVLDAGAHKERKFQHCAPVDVVNHVLALRGCGCTVDASAEDDGKFTVKVDAGKTLTTESAVLAVPLPDQP